jgi:hypothetical protein
MIATTQSAADDLADWLRLAEEALAAMAEDGRITLDWPRWRYGA